MRLIYHTTPSRNLENFSSLARCFGLTPEHLDISHHDGLASALNTPESAGDKDIVLDVASFCRKYKHEALTEAGKVLAGSEANVLLLVFESDSIIDSFLQSITNGAVCGAKLASRATSVSFPANCRAFSGELSSFSFPRTAKPGLILEVPNSEKVNRVMLLDQSASYVHLQHGRTQMFIWSTENVFDMYQPLGAEKDFEEAADQYVPAIIYLRFALGKRCWHNPNAGAGIVIDDPLLKKHYGFIKFPQLLESAKNHRYHVTLAFIPWNHWRSSPKQVELFRRYSSCFSICSHGCDHLNNEFKSRDYDELLTKNFLARQRMQRHTERTGLECEPLMVCPQEQYSLEAMRAFADSRQFIGLVCTACIPKNLSSFETCGADLLLPAQDSFFGFPVFKRHYFEDGLFRFAMDLFLGKHAILVEHHEFFKNGPENAEKFVEWLANVRPDIQWTSLARIASGTHLVRHCAENEREVRFFTDAFNFEHKSEKALTYRFSRRIPDTAAIRHVLINDAPMDATQKNGYLSFEIQTSQPQTLRVQLDICPRKPLRLYTFGIKYHASVACRRFLSELRDNVIVRNATALRAGRFLARTLRQTSN